MRDLDNLYSSPNSINKRIKEDEMGMKCRMHEESEKHIQLDDPNIRRKETTRDTLRWVLYKYCHVFMARGNQ
jgi:hypothetical protein